MLFHSVSTLGNSNASSYKKIGYGNRDAMLDSRLEVCLFVFRDIRFTKYTQEGIFMLASLICGASVTQLQIHLELVNSII